MIKTKLNIRIKMNNKNKLSLITIKFSKMINLISKRKVSWLPTIRKNSHKLIRLNSLINQTMSKISQSMTYRDNPHNLKNNNRKSIIKGSSPWRSNKDSNSCYKQRNRKQNWNWKYRKNIRCNHLRKHIKSYMSKIMYLRTRVTIAIVHKHNSRNKEFNLIQAQKILKTLNWNFQ